MKKLNTCPFCGGDITLLKEKYNEDVFYNYICSDEKCILFATEIVIYGSLPEVILQANKRAEE